MTAIEANPSPRSGSPLESVTPARAQRRTALLDAAAEMVAGGAIEAVSMEAIAERVGVSRALVYKHFANRHELLSSLYERESKDLHAELAVAVDHCASLEEMLRALVEGALGAQAARGTTFAALTSAGGRSRSQRELQRRRDARTLNHFSRQAVAELGLDEAAAKAGLGLALNSIAIVLNQWRQRPTAEHAVRLADTYVAMTMGGLQAVATRS